MNPDREFCAGKKEDGAAALRGSSLCKGGLRKVSAVIADSVLKSEYSRQKGQGRSLEYLTDHYPEDCFA